MRPDAAPRVLRLTMAIALLALLACDRLGGAADGCSKDGDCKGDRVCQSGQCVAPALAATDRAAAPAANAGMDPHAPVLSPDDATFTDTRRGWGWSDRCWAEEHAGKYGWAMAACQRGLEAPDLDAKAKPALLYNQGLALEGAGDRAGAMGFFERSLGLRGANDPGRAEVAAALKRVGGTPPAMTSPTYACGHTRCAKSQICCAETKCIGARGPGDETCMTPSEQRQCDPKTDEPCPPGQKCREGKIGAGPLSITFLCQ